MIDYNSQIILYPGTVSEKGSRQVNARQDVMTLGELISFLKLPAESGGGAVLSVPGNLGCDVTTAQLPYLIAMAAAGFDMSRIKVATSAEMPDDVNLSNSNFSRATMAGLVINATNVADWSSSNLSGILLAGAILTHVNLDGSNLSYAILNDSILTSCDVTNCDLSYASLDGVIIDGICNFNNSDFTHANLKNVTFVLGASVDFTGSNLSFVELYNTDFNMSIVVMDEITANGMIADGVSFVSGTTTGATLENCSFNAAVFSNAGFANSSMFKCSFVAATFDASSSIAGTYFETCDFTDTVWTSVSIAAASFLGCNFGGAGINDVFTSANLDGQSDGDTVTWVDGTVYEWSTDTWIEA